ncbi:type II secretion system F family protein [Alkalicoccus halolimnae]|uniref:Type II secretion system F family protein n=1 Tax=Alkalicoccus halolimnae TaxID=1667239 RepID=A0A5C7FFL7_9BACI|nr:type II secretion system F family protein [Alkalicoccus halolimnae]TXF86087.1 type II secretion system F family protein [Alkalicoccus halolimnae]
MNPLLILPFLLLFTTLLAAAVFITLNRRQIQLQSRTEMYVGVSERSRLSSDREKQPHLLDSIWDKGIGYTKKFVTPAEQKKVEILLRDAGYLKKRSAFEFRFFQLALALTAGLGGALFFTALTESAGSVILFSSVFGLLGYRLPLFYLKKQRDKRIKQINLDMPDFFDTVNLLIEAGVGVDAAISSVCHKKPGPLSDEFLIMLDDMKRGKSKREAFHDLKRRVPSASFQAIITSMIQADQLGIGLSNVLRNLTVRIREQRRESAREQAMKAPVKMLFPMVLFIFPALFMVILGPFAVDMVVNGFF